MAILGGNGGDVVQAIAGGVVNLLGSNRRAVLVDKRDGVRDHVVVGDDDGVIGGNVGGVDAWAKHMDLAALATLNDFANCPVCVVVFAGNSCGKCTDSGILLNLNSLIDLRIAVVEGYSPDVIVCSPESGELALGSGNLLGLSLFLSLGLRLSRLLLSLGLVLGSLGLFGLRRGHHECEG